MYKELTGVNSAACISLISNTRFNRFYLFKQQMETLKWIFRALLSITVYNIFTILCFVFASFYFIN